MTAFLIIDVIIVLLIVIFFSNKKTKTHPQYTLKTNPGKEVNTETSNKISQNINIKMNSSVSNNTASDYSIIDITGNSYQINPAAEKPSLVKYAKGVPYWRHQYVYSYSEINGATSEQTKFYQYFK